MTKSLTAIAAGTGATQPAGGRSSWSHPALAAAFLALALVGSLFSQPPHPTASEVGSRTAREGFRNEDRIRDKFNDWKTDEDARVWLGFMGFKVPETESVTAAKPHGEKADVEVTVESRSGVKTEGISIKLVSTENGFNQIDKRWLSTYAKMWRMPKEIEAALRLFVGEDRPNKPSRNPERMFLNELEPEARKRIVEFFSANKAEIVSDLFKGDGEHRAGWMMVALKSAAKPRWALRSIDYAIEFYAAGPVEITLQGNLKIGRITMQRKGGDGGRETAKMLQFKINPALLFESGEPR